ncbi:MAG TPA: hypothetical protein VF601_16830 [Beijerinckiaceae bacterium]|jgi:hypothetical protein
MEEDAFPDPEDAARRVADLIEKGVTERMLHLGSRRAHGPLFPLAGRGLG